MTNSKKILSLALAIVMALSVWSISAFAAATTPTATFTVTASETEVSVDDVITVTVKANATENFYAGPMSIPVEYDSDLFTYVANSATGANIYGATSTAITINADEAGKVVAVYSPKTAGAATAPNLNGANLTVLTFQLKAVASGSCTINVANDQKTATNNTGKFYCGSFDGTNPKNSELTEMGQTLNRAGVTVTVLGGAAAEPVLTGVDTGFVDDALDYVYGVPAGKSAEEFIAYFAVENGTFEISGTGTGDTLTVKTAGGDVYKTYTIIVFGDVDGSGTITSDDYVAVKFATMTTPLTGAYAYAADVDASGSITSDDYVAVKFATMTTPLDPDPYH